MHSVGIAIAPARQHHRPRAPAGGERNGGKDQAPWRPRDGLTTDVHTLADALQRFLKLIVTAGQIGDITQALSLLNGQAGDAVLADKAYDSNALCSVIAIMDAEEAIPSNRCRKVAVPHAAIVCRHCNRISRRFSSLMHIRRFAIRYDRRTVHFAGGLKRRPWPVCRAMQMRAMAFDLMNQVDSARHAESLAAAMMFDGPTNHDTFVTHVCQILRRSLDRRHCHRGQFGEVQGPSWARSHRAKLRDSCLSASDKALTSIWSSRPSSSWELTFWHATERTIHDFWIAIGRILDLHLPQECANHFASAGHDGPDFLAVRRSEGSPDGHWAENYLEGVRPSSVR